MSLVLLKEVLSLGDAVDGEEEVAVDGVGGVNAVPLRIYSLLKRKAQVPSKTMSPAILREVLSLGEEVDGEDEEVEDGVGDVNVVLLMMLQLSKPKISIPSTTMNPLFLKEVLNHGDVVDGEDAVVVGDGENNHFYPLS